MNAFRVQENRNACAGSLEKSTSTLPIVVFRVVVLLAGACCGIGCNSDANTATAYLRVFRVKPTVIPGGSAYSDTEEYKTYKATQEQMIKNPFVLDAALRDPRVKGLPSIVEADERHEAKSWLASHLRIGSPDENSEILSVSLTGASPDEAKKLVDSVVTAYRVEVVDRERIDRKNQLDRLDRIHAERENDLRSKLAEFRKMEEETGSELDIGDSPKKQIATAQTMEALTELSSLQSELTHARIDLAVLERLKDSKSADRAALEARVAILADHVKLAQDLVAERRENLDRTYHVSVDLDIMHKEIVRAEKVLDRVSNERDILRVELGAPARVVALGNEESPSEVPKKSD